MTGVITPATAAVLEAALKLKGEEWELISFDESAAITEETIHNLFLEINKTPDSLDEYIGMPAFQKKESEGRRFDGSPKRGQQRF